MSGISLCAFRQRHSNLGQIVTNIVRFQLMTVFQALKHDYTVPHVAIKNVGFFVMAPAAGASNQPGLNKMGKA